MDHKQLVSISGPFAYLPFKKSLGAIIVGMSIHGFGLGASVVGGFSDAHKSAIKAGFPDTIDTYGLVSGLWTSVFAFGAFVGEPASHAWLVSSHFHSQVPPLEGSCSTQSPSGGPSSW